jgi:hypothetical protein
MKIVPATEGLIREYYGDEPIPTMRAWVVLDGEKPVAVGGFVRISQKVMAVFSESKEGEREQHKLTALKFAKTLMKIADEHDWTLVADPACDIETATKFLAHLGFEPNENGVYVRWAD